MKIPSPSVVNGRFLTGGIPAEDLVREFGSPLYVYDESVIRSRYQKLNQALSYPKKRIHYAMKANNNMAVLKVLLGENCYIDAVSPEEARIAMKAGYPADRILLTAVNQTPEDMRFAVQNGIPLNIGSVAALETYGSLFPGTAVSIRVNPDFGAGHHSHVITGGRESKFGIFHGARDASDVGRAMEIAKKSGLKIVGVHAHIGSGILDERQYIDLMKIILKLASEIPGLEFVDFGGGIGVPYRPEEKEFDLAGFGAHADRLMSDFSRSYGSEPVLALEPGRYLVAESGTLLVTVTDVKKTPKFHFVGVDSGFNHLIRPMAYGSYHPIVNASRPEGTARPVVVAGYLCESGDLFTRGEHGPEERLIADPRVGDVLAVMNAGAYGFAMASNYNARPRPAEVMISDGRAKLVRRRESLDDMLACQL